MSQQDADARLKSGVQTEEESVRVQSDNSERIVSSNSKPRQSFAHKLARQLSTGKAPATVWNKLTGCLRDIFQETHYTIIKTPIFGLPRSGKSTILMKLIEIFEPKVLYFDIATVLTTNECNQQVFPYHYRFNDPEIEGEFGEENLDHDPMNRSYFNINFFEVVDCSNMPKIGNYIVAANYVTFAVDASDSAESIIEAKRLMYDIATEKVPRSVPCIILLTKTDKFCQLTIEQVLEILDLDNLPLYQNLPGKFKRTYHVITTSAVDGTGLIDYFDYMCASLKVE